MTRGEVQYNRSATVSVVVRGRGGAEDLTVEAVVDTGFDGFLSLPTALIQQLNLDFVGRRKSAVFGGAVVLFDVYLAAVELSGEGRGIIAFAAENPPLIGMGLLDGFQLCVDIMSNGTVTLTRRPDEPMTESKP